MQRFSRIPLCYSVPEGGRYGVPKSVHGDSGDVLYCILGVGMIEYWRSTGHSFPEEDVEFSSKLDTDLYAHAKAKTTVQSLEVSQDGAQFVTFSSDRCLQTSSSKHRIGPALNS